MRDHRWVRDDSTLRPDRWKCPRCGKTVYSTRKPSGPVGGNVAVTEYRGWIEETTISFDCDVYYVEKVMGS